MFLLGATLLYPIFSTRAKIQDRFEESVSHGLNGMAFMEQAVLRDKDQRIPLRHDLEAIRWMQQNVDGSPVIAEVNTAPTLYGWGNRFAVFTGNPAVIGWDWHQRQQRTAVPGTMVNRRIEDIQKAYSTTDPDQAYRILSKYGVQYFVVGGLERAYYPAGQAKWRSREGRLWEVAYENPGVKIYRLFEPSLARAGNGTGTGTGSTRR